MYLIMYLDRFIKLAVTASLLLSPQVMGQKILQQTEIKGLLVI